MKRRLLTLVAIVCSACTSSQITDPGTRPCRQHLPVACQRDSTTHY